MKRVNKLISDQDFYALTAIKVPVKQYSSLLETLQKDSAGGCSGVNSENCNSNFQDGVVNSGQLYRDDSGSDYDDNPASHLISENVRTVSIRQQSHEAVNFLQKMDTDIKSIVTSTKSRLDSLDDVKHRLTCRRFFPLESKKTSAGADFGIRWWNAVIVGLIVIVVAPTVLFFYYKINQNTG